MPLVLKGVMQSPVTPLKEDFSPDLATFEKLLDFHVRTGATAISWPHHKGESLNLTIAERKAFAEVAVKVVAGRIPVSIHVSALAVEDSMELARHAQETGADAIIAHVGTTIGGSIGVTGAAITMKEAVQRVQSIIDAGRSVRKDIFFLSHGGPISKPEDAAYINEHTDAVGFVGASSLERLAVEDSLTELTKTFKKIPVQKHALKAYQARTR